MNWKTIMIAIMGLAVIQSSLLASDPIPNRPKRNDGPAQIVPDRPKRNDSHGSPIQRPKRNDGPESIRGWLSALIGR